HHGFEARGAKLLVELAEAVLFLDDLALFHRGFAGLDDHVRLEIKYGLEVAQRNIEQVSDARRQSLKEPNVRAGRRQLDVPQPLAADLGHCDFHAALVTNHAAMFHPFVLAAQTLPVRDRPKNAGTEQAVSLRLESAVVDGFWLSHLAVRPAP